MGNSEVAQPPDLLVRLSPQQCADQVNAHTDSVWTLLGRRPVIGKLSARGGTLEWRHWLSRNDFKSLLRVQFTAADTGTQVRLRLGMSYGTIWFLGIWCGIMLLATLAISVPYLLRLALGPSTADSPGDALFPAYMLGGAGIVTLLGRLLGYGEGERLVEFLRKALEAEGERPDCGGS